MLFNPTFPTPSAIDVLNTRSEFTGSPMLDTYGTKLGINGTDITSNNPLSNVIADDASSSMGNSDSTFSQVPSELTSNGVGGASNSDGSASANSSAGANVLAFPTGLGTGNLSHYVKLEVYIVKTENMNLINGGGTQSEVDDNAVPRIAQGVGEVREKQLNAVKLVKLQEMIGLPVPDSVLSDYSMDWSRSEGGMISNTISFVDAMGNEDARGKVDFLNTVAMTAGTRLSSLVSALGADGASTNLKLLTKRASNPRNEFLFNGVNNRSFNMSWKFIPKDADESKNLQVILEKLKLYMHPELDESTAGKFYIFPAVFDITYMIGNAENEYLPRTSTCALTNFTVNHTAGGMPMFFDGTNAPYGYDVIAQFTEMEFLHRARFKTASNTEGVAR